MKTLAHELAPASIRVNTVHPTGVHTPMVHNDYLTAKIEQSPVWANALTNLPPVELIEPSDVPNAMVWLCSDERRYVTGVALPVDAGFTTR